MSVGCPSPKWISVASFPDELHTHLSSLSLCSPIQMKVSAAMPVKYDVIALLSLPWLREYIACGFSWQQGQWCGTLNLVQPYLHKEKTVVGPSYLFNGYSYTGKTASLFWDDPMNSEWFSLHMLFVWFSYNFSIFRNIIRFLGPRHHSSRNAAMPSQHPEGNGWKSKICTVPQRKHHVTGTLWRVKPLTTRLFAEKLIKIILTETTRALHHCLFIRPPVTKGQ